MALQEAAAARQQERLDSHGERIRGHARTLYGDDGRGGLVSILTTLAANVESFMAEVRAMVARLRHLLLGEDEAGRTGLVADVATWRRTMSATLWWLKYVATPLGLAVLGGLLAADRIP